MIILRYFCLFLTKHFIDNDCARICIFFIKFTYMHLSYRKKWPWIHFFTGPKLTFNFILNNDVNYTWFYVMLIDVGYVFDELTRLLLWYCSLIIRFCIFIRVWLFDVNVSIHLLLIFYFICYVYLSGDSKIVNFWNMIALSFFNFSFFILSNLYEYTIKWRPPSLSELIPY